MFRLLGLMVTIGLADSINPSTIAPALYLAHGRHPRARVAEFTLSVFIVYLAGGALLALGPGELLRSILPHPHREERAIAELVAGVILLLAAAIVFHQRGRLQDRGLPAGNPKRRSSILLGATITAIELPTAFPYFAAIAALIGSGFGAPHVLFLLIVFNVCFVLPLLGILATLIVGGSRAERILSACRDFLERRWPHVLAALMLLVGIYALLIGATGLAALGHGRVGRFFRHFRRVLHLHG